MNPFYNGCMRLLRISLTSQSIFQRNPWLAFDSKGVNFRGENLLFQQYHLPRLDEIACLEVDIRNQKDQLSLIEPLSSNINH